MHISLAIFIIVAVCASAVVGSFQDGYPTQANPPIPFNSKVPEGQAGPEPSKIGITKKQNSHPESTLPQNGIWPFQPKETLDISGEAYAQESNPLIKGRPKLQNLQKAIKQSPTPEKSPSVGLSQPIRSNEQPMQQTLPFGKAPLKGRFIPHSPLDKSNAPNALPKEAPNGNPAGTVVEGPPKHRKLLVEVPKPVNSISDQPMGTPRRFDRPNPPRQIPEIVPQKQIPPQNQTPRKEQIPQQVPQQNQIPRQVPPQNQNPPQNQVPPQSQKPQQNQNPPQNQQPPQGQNPPQNPEQNPPLQQNPPQNQIPPQKQTPAQDQPPQSKKKPPMSPLLQQQQMSPQQQMPASPPGAASSPMQMAPPTVPNAMAAGPGSPPPAAAAAAAAVAGSVNPMAGGPGNMAPGLVGPMPIHPHAMGPAGGAMFGPIGPMGPVLQPLIPPKILPPGQLVPPIVPPPMVMPHPDQMGWM